MALSSTVSDPKDSYNHDNNNTESNGVKSNGSSNGTPLPPSSSSAPSTLPPSSVPLRLQSTRKQSQSRKSVCIVTDTKETATLNGNKDGSRETVKMKNGLAACRRARKVRFFINNDRFYKGAVIAVNEDKFRSLDKLLEHLTRVMCSQSKISKFDLLLNDDGKVMTLPCGVRFIFGLDGHEVNSIAQLGHDQSFVVSSYPQFKRIDYLRIELDQQQQTQQFRRLKRESCYLGVSKSNNAMARNGPSKSFSVKSSNGIEAQNGESRNLFKPKIVAVVRGGKVRPRKVLRVLLNQRNTHSFETLLTELTDVVKLDAGAVRKVCKLNGDVVSGIDDFADCQTFIVFGADFRRQQQEDFKLDVIEYKHVKAILGKSVGAESNLALNRPGSPKSSRKKLLATRQKVNSKKNKKIDCSDDNNHDNNNYGNDSNEFDEDNRSSSKSSLFSCNSEPKPTFPSSLTDHYNIGEILGDGNFAIVRVCTNRNSGKHYALKSIDKRKCEGKEHMIASEVSILRSIAHPNIIELIHVFDMQHEQHLLTELVSGGDLFDAIAADVKFNEDESRHMLRDLALALQYLHDQAIVHRDIKPENLLVEMRGQHQHKSLKLADFGLAVHVQEPLFTVCGTPTYVAPEILAETGYGVKVDVWAAGVILYILLVGYPPFSSRSNNQEELFDQILSGLFEFPSPDWDEVSYEAKELIGWTLQVDPLQRFSAFEMLQHPWITQKATAKASALKY